MTRREKFPYPDTVLAAIRDAGSASHNTLELMLGLPNGTVRRATATLRQDGKIEAFATEPSATGKGNRRDVYRVLTPQKPGAPND